MTSFAASSSAQIVFLAGMFSGFLHILAWQSWQGAALETEPAVIAQRLEFALLSPPEPKQAAPVIQPKSDLPKPESIENTKPKVIPKVVSKALPLVKPFPKPIRKISEPALSKINPPLAKREMPLDASKPAIQPDAAPPGRPGGGYGIASQTGQGSGSGIGLGGGSGNGTESASSSRNDRRVTGADENASSGFSKGVVVLERTQPEYPERALKRRIEGRVTMEFIIKPNGEITKLTIVSAEPGDIFNEAALTAIKKWKFKQKIVNGMAVEQRALQTLSFKLKKP